MAVELKAIWSWLPRIWFAVLVIAASLIADPPPRRIGVIGPESNHGVNFTKLINDPEAPGLYAKYEVVAAYPTAQLGTESKPGTVPGWDQQMTEMGVDLVDSVDELLQKVEFVMVLTDDGRPHLKDALRVIDARKALYVDKPVAPSLKEVIALYEAAERSGVPVFSSSSLRFTSTAQAVRGGSIGQVLGADTYTPAPLDAGHTDLFWYGIHGVEPLFTVMGTGCNSVTRVHTEHFDVVTGIWADGRIGTVRGMRKGLHAYGGTAFGEKANAAFGEFEGYGPLVVKILEFFETGKPPVTPAETLEIYTFMEAADESKRCEGVPVLLSEVIGKARADAQDLLVAPRER